MVKLGFQGTTIYRGTYVFTLRFPACICPLESNPSKFEFCSMLYSENADGGADIIRSCFPGMYETEIKNFYSRSTFTTNFSSLKCMSE